jgi:hypothetical protein
LKIMEQRDEIKWAPRLPKWKLRRLYESDAKGLLDEELLEDVGTILYQRCKSILLVAQAKDGRVRCPRCEYLGTTTFIERPQTKGDIRDVILKCSVCGWQITWGEYHKSFKRHQLNVGGAAKVFEAYVQDYKVAQASQTKILAIDRLIHGFHYSFRARPDLPSRPVCVNLIQGKLADVIRFLDELTYGKETNTALVENRAEWQERIDNYHDFLDLFRSKESDA